MDFGVGLLEGGTFAGGGFEGGAVGGKVGGDFLWGDFEGGGDGLLDPSLLVEAVAEVDAEGSGGEALAGEGGLESVGVGVGGAEGNDFCVDGGGGDVDGFIAGPGAQDAVLDDVLEDVDFEGEEGLAGVVGELVAAAEESGLDGGVELGGGDRLAVDAGDPAAGDGIELLALEEVCGEGAAEPVEIDEEVEDDDAVDSDAPGELGWGGVEGGSPVVAF